MVLPAGKVFIPARLAGWIGVLAYLAAWDGRYNYNWPRYEADERMGGADGLRKYCRQEAVVAPRTNVGAGGNYIADFFTQTGEVSR